MKIIDKTPFQNDKGEIELWPRIQGTLRYGFNWYSELQAQKVVMDQFERILEKGFALIRNFNLPGSEIIVPFILVGTHGVTVIHVTPLRGFYEAKGDQWNRLDNGRSLPARVDLINLTTRLARATQKYLEIQKITIPGPVEPVIICADPGLHVDTLRPIIKVVMSDAIKQFAATLMQNRTALRGEQVYDIADRIVTPHASDAPSPQSAPTPATAAAASSQQPASRAKAIFDAADKTPAFDPSDLSFALGESETNIAPQGLPPGVSETSPVRRLPSSNNKPEPQKGKVLGMSPAQLGILAGIVIVECCVIVAGAYLLLFNH